MNIVKTIGIGAAAGFAAGLGFVSWAVGIERRRFVLREIEVAVLPAGARPLKVLHVADAHLAPGQGKKMRFVQSLAAHEPDLIIATGDNLGHKNALPPLAEMLEPFRGIPALSVFGSNDYFGPVFKNPFTYLLPRKPATPRPRDLDEAGLRRLLFDDLGWTDLTNSAAIIDVKGVRIRAIGVDDPHIKKDDYASARTELSALSAGAQWDLTLGLVHAPYQHVLDRYADDVRADMVFAGHTHGGQVCKPGGRAIVSNCDLPVEYAGGLSWWDADAGDSVPLHVSRGLGTSIYAPVRTFCPPEATLITLMPRA
ncbi:metallophosphoesterase [Gulosibacter bifidus]|uniref:Metallophosphoesterase n=1 Tax=Gulosibacter bifidus TaxID=272239 RepID=A0ABW5RKR9_9MICO|nr:metallophosphoesterase [Gulosibacter bifidus]